MLSKTLETLNSYQSGYYPPPPPPPTSGRQPSNRLSTEIPDRRMEPPACVQNAMMTKDKKPFTYTPGGIDLSEIRSPRMARRIERNAHYGGENDVPRQAGAASGPPPPPPGPLPPSALAAMQPQIQVQVLPPGGIPLRPQGPNFNNGAPVTPAPPPPPAPPVMPPLPTQKVITSGGGTLERPDMTKIIPDNPMAMLKKTGGPAPRKSFVDEMYSAPPPEPPRMIQRTPVIERSPPIYQAPPQNEVKPNTGVGQLYIGNPKSPPLPLTPQSPNSPPILKEAPKPWQNRPQFQQSEVPAWAKRDESPHSPSTQTPQDMRCQQPETPQPQMTRPQPIQVAQGTPIHIEVRARQAPSPVPSYSQPPQNYPIQVPPPNYPQVPQNVPNAVYVSQPLIFQHPGPRMGPPPQPRGPPPQAKAQSQNNTRIIPIMIEGQAQSPTNDRLSRQQSWGNNPTQSNSFKVIQKITQTEGGEDEVEAPVTSHAPKYPQQYQQIGGDRDLVNRFRQDDGETFLHNETDPRYRGAAIPSKAFKLLQNMTDGSSNTPTNRPSGPNVSQPINSGPQVRTIPIQMEGNGQAQYVHPSEQITPEPKKYMGSSIPSRSFRMLQAMTAQDECAKPAGNVENNNAPTNERWNYDPTMLPYPYAYPYPDYYYYPDPQQGLSSAEVAEQQAYWNYYAPYYSSAPSSSENSEATTPSTPSTPQSMPYWNYGYPPQYNNSTVGNDQQSSEVDTYMSYYDPYYYYYYYGYTPPPMYSGYPMYNTDTEDQTGYSSTDEMLRYNANAPTPKIEEKKKVEQSDTEEEDSQRDNTVTPQPMNSDDEGDTSDATLEDSEIKSSKPNADLEDEEVGEPEEYEEDEDDIDEEQSVCSVEEPIPHQLSIIMEETERSESRGFTEDDDATTIHDSEAEEELEEDDEVEDEEEVSTTFSIKLPNKHKTPELVVEEEEPAVFASFTLKRPSPCKHDAADTDNDEDVDSLQEDKLERTMSEVTTASEYFIILEEESEEEISKIGELRRSRKSMNCSSTKIEARCMKTESSSSSDDESDTESEEVRRNSVLSRNEIRKPVIIKPEIKEPENKKPEIKKTENKTLEIRKPEVKKIVKQPSSSSDDEDLKESDSTWWSIQPVKSPEPLNYQSFKTVNEKSPCSAGSLTSSSSKSEASSEPDPDSEPPTIEIKSIKERIKALKESIKAKKKKLKVKDEHKNSVKDKISAIEIKKVEPKFNYEYLSEDEGDSGVTSDVSRHISDSEEFQELQKINKYQRAATHSRLFQLLQEECNEEEAKEQETISISEDKFNKLSVRQRQNSREHLSLPLKNINKPEPEPITISDRLVDELIISLLNSKKGQALRNIPKDKLKSTALRVLQEDFDDETPSSGYNSWLSPPRGSTESSSPAQTPQDFYGTYNDYYDTWNDVEGPIEGQNAFNKTTPDQISSKSLPKCPRVFEGAKNVRKAFKTLLDSPCLSPTRKLSSCSPSPNAEITNTS